jgi:AcrR family transcriptional regulator
MPKVSAEHRTARREQIVMAGWKCVAREGFHKTTMADVVRESGLSAGAVYGYFRSKDDIIAAIADRAVGTVDELFDAMMARPDPPTPSEAIRILTSQAVVLAELPAGDVTRVALQVWGEALRNEAIHATVAEKYTRVRGKFAELVRVMQGAGHVDQDADPELVAQVLFGLLPGFLVQRLILGDITPDSYADGLAALLAGTSVRR